MIPPRPNTSKTVVYPCPECGFQFVVDREYHGKQAYCRHCRQSVLVDLHPPAAKPETPPVEQTAKTPVRASRRPVFPAVASQAPAAPPQRPTKRSPKREACPKCSGRVCHEFLVSSDLWWTDRRRELIEPIIDEEPSLTSPVIRCISCGLVRFTPAEWLPPHAESAAEWGRKLADDCIACGAKAEAGYLIDRRGKPAQLWCETRSADFQESFCVNEGQPHVPIPATYCRVCGTIKFMGRKWINEQGVGGANLKGEP